MTNGVLAKFLRFWFPVILYSGIILYISSIPNVKTPLQEVNFDKLLHVLEYLPFGFLLARAICSLRRPLSVGLLVLAVGLGALLLGMCDEYSQSLVVGRNSNLNDLIADTVGGFLGSYLYQLFYNKK